jgi:hypothetical protein
MCRRPERNESLFFASLFFHSCLMSELFAAACGCRLMLKSWDRCMLRVGRTKTVLKFLALAFLSRVHTPHWPNRNQSAK